MVVKVFSVVMCLAVASAIPTAPVQECPEYCNEIYVPVCGSDDRTYDNQCFLSIASCLNPDIVVQSQGTCGQADPVQCHTLCAADYSPVCGSDGQTYSNACALSVASCQNPTDLLATAYDGKCKPEVPIEECLSVCPFYYDPVCGSDGITYSNECALAVASCQNPNANIATVYNGECDPTVTV